MYSTRTVLELHCLQSLVWTLESEMRRRQRCVLLRVTPLRSRGPSLLLRDRPNSHRVTKQHAERREGKGGEARRGSAPLLLRSRVPWGFWISADPAWGDYPKIWCSCEITLWKIQNNLENNLLSDEILLLWNKLGVASGASLDVTEFVCNNIHSSENVYWLLDFWGVGDFCMKISYAKFELLLLFANINSLLSRT
jgi:hypothetical protein